MKKNFKTIISLLVISLLTTVCSSGGGDGLSSLILSRLLSTKKTNTTTATQDTIDVANTFSNLQTAMIYKSDKAGVRNAFSSIDAGNWAKLGSLGKLVVPKGVTLTFAISASATPLTSTNTKGIIEFGKYKAVGNHWFDSTNKFGFKSLTEKVNGSTDYGISALAIAVKKAESHFKRSELLAALAQKGTDIVKSTDSKKASEAVKNAVGTIFGAKYITDATTEAKIKEAIEDANGSKGGNSDGASAKVGDFSNQSITITLTKAKFLNINKENVVADFYSKPVDINKIARLKKRGQASISIFIKKISDTQIHMGLSSSKEVSSLLMDYVFSFKKGSIDNEWVRDHHLTNISIGDVDGGIIIKDVIKNDKEKIVLKEVSGTVPSEPAIVMTAYYNGSKKILTLEGSNLAPQSCTTCTATADNFKNDAELLAALKKMALASNTPNNYKVTTKTSGAISDGTPTTDEADILNDTAPTNDNATYAYKKDGTKIWIRLHDDEVNTINAYPAYSKNKTIPESLTLAPLTNSSGFGLPNTNTGKYLFGIEKGSSTVTNVIRSQVKLSNVVLKNKTTGTAGKLESGDQIVLTFDKAASVDTSAMGTSYSLVVGGGDLKDTGSKAIKVYQGTTTQDATTLVAKIQFKASATIGAVTATTMTGVWSKSSESDVLTLTLKGSIGPLPSSALTASVGKLAATLGNGTKAKAPALPTDVDTSTKDISTDAAAPF